MGFEIKTLKALKDFFEADGLGYEYFPYREVFPKGAKKFNVYEKNPETTDLFYRVPKLPVKLKKEIKKQLSTRREIYWEYEIVIYLYSSPIGNLVEISDPRDGMKTSIYVEWFL